MKRLASIGLLVMTSLTASLMTFPAVAEEAVSFAGKTITLIVASAAGGGTDVSGRVIAGFLAQHLPGTPTVIGGVGRGGSVLVIRKDAEARLHDKTKPPVIMGALSGVPRSGMQTTGWGIEFLGWNAKWVLAIPAPTNYFWRSTAAKST